MAVSVVMPALEMAQEKGKLIAWLKQEGEAVHKGDRLLEIETDKAVVEIEAAADGLLAGVTAGPGDVIPVGQTIAWLIAPGESVPAGASTLRQPPAPSLPAFDLASGPASSTASAHTSPLASAVRLSPKARKLARDHRVDVNTLTGSGPGGEVLANDVLGAAASSSPNVPLTSAGRLMAERTVQSWTTIPHFFVTRNIDATALRSARTRLTAPIQQADAVKLTYTDLIVAAVARALREHPRMNASWAGGTITVHRHVNVALAIAVENAVVAAVIRDADRISLGAMAKQRSELTARARAGRLRPADISDATFTISNLGMFDVDAFTAIIVPPQAGILAIGALADRAAVVDGAIAVRPTMTLTLSADHRVIDGAGAAAFLNDVVLALCEPDKWL